MPLNISATVTVSAPVRIQDFQDAVALQFSLKGTTPFLGPLALGSAAARYLAAVFIALAQGRALSYVRNDIGATCQETSNVPFHSLAAIEDGACHATSTFGNHHILPANKTLRHSPATPSSDKA
jgi:hypothetical protein